MRSAKSLFALASLSIIFFKYAGTSTVQTSSSISIANEKFPAKGFSLHLRPSIIRLPLSTIDKTIFWGDFSKTMKLIRFGEPGKEKPGVLLNGNRLDVSEFGSDYDEAFFGSGGLARLDSWLRSNAASVPKVAGSVRLSPPICRPSKIVCIGLNYRDHAAETKAEAPKEPVLFFKATSSLVGPNDALVIPKNATKVDWEVELAVVISKKSSIRLQGTGARSCGRLCALHNDYSERSFQLERGGQWVKRGRAPDTFAPVRTLSRYAGRDSERWKPSHVAKGKRPVPAEEFPRQT